MVAATLEIINIFAKSQNLSTLKGKSNLLMKGIQKGKKLRHSDE